MAYSTFCWAVGELRQTPPVIVPREPNAAERSTAPRRAGENARLLETVDDPLRNIRRLSERRPGFDYRGTLPDEKLFGPK